MAMRAGWGDAIAAMVALGLVVFAVAPTQAKAQVASHLALYRWINAH